MREFHISDILSITTGRLVSTRHVEGVYEILNYMTGDNLFTHQLPRASRVCAPHLLRQHPQLKDVYGGGVTKDNWKEWLKEMTARFGETLSVEPLRHFEHIDPLKELTMIVDKP